MCCQSFSPNPTVYPNTTFLIPLKKYPIMNLQITDSQPPSPGFLPTIDIETTGQSKLRTLYVVGSAVGFCLVLVALLVCGLYVKALRKWKVERLLSFNARSSCSIASPDLLKLLEALQIHVCLRISWSE